MLRAACILSSSAHPGSIGFDLGPVAATPGSMSLRRLLLLAPALLAAPDLEPACPQQDLRQWVSTSSSGSAGGARSSAPPAAASGQNCRARDAAVLLRLLIELLIQHDSDALPQLCARPRRAQAHTQALLVCCVIYSAYSASAPRHMARYPGGRRSADIEDAGSSANF